MWLKYSIIIWDSVPFQIFQDKQKKSNACIEMYSIMYG